MELRDYQKQAVAAALEYFRAPDVKNKKPIIVAPTGSGKSLIIAAITHELKEGVLVIQPSKELLEQNHHKYKLYGGDASIYSASMNKKEIGAVTFATIGSIQKKPELFSHVRYILIDECHLLPPHTDSMFMRFLSGVEDVRVVGLTATPFRLKQFNDPFSGLPYTMICLLTRMRPKFFNEYLHVTQTRELYDTGYLAPVKYIPLVWDDDMLVVNTTGAEYTEESMDRAIEAQMVYEKLPGIIQQSIDKGRKHRLVFVKHVLHAELLASIVPDSAFVCAQTPKKERDRILKLFRAGIIGTVFNVGVLTIGFDFPALDTIIIARPTMSLALYIQMIGRGIRKCEGKTDCAVVDMCGTYSRFGQIENMRYEQDELGKWVVKNGEKVLSGVKLEK